MGTGARSGAAGLTVLRQARAADAEAILDIETASFTDPWSRQALMTAIAAPSLLVTVATADDDDCSIHGYSVIARAVDEAELLNLAVASSLRGKGIGWALVERAIADARRWGAKALFLEVRASNDDARRLYARAGFEEVGRRRSYYRRPLEDALILRRALE